jgi:hypothetical protein
MTRQSKEKGQEYGQLNDRIDRIEKRLELS